eukprot:TRINITY_DN4885_c0_g1_i1.p1 TRINITY_DN4885_c0_g1~~TRINITY_DN4885_c0_g1_i1.p1  ORF type:complete len:631 (+),score=246.45 TRINITY_DN4885_c0_g1_i1:97-1989(+)
MEGNKFAHLLQPIKDLADNWNVDLASELEEYMEDLDKISFSFDGKGNTLNFAEAALLIQSSANIYSKKVEFLYKLIYQTLEFLANKQKMNEKKNNTDKENINIKEEDSGNQDQEDDQIFLKKTELKEGKNINLVEDENQSNNLILENLNIDTSFHLITNMNQNNFNHSSNFLKQTDYCINKCLIDPSGGLLLDNRFDFQSNFPNIQEYNVMETNENQLFGNALKKNGEEQIITHQSKKTQENEGIGIDLGAASSEDSDEENDNEKDGRENNKVKETNNDNNIPATNLIGSSIPIPNFGSKGGVERMVEGEEVEEEEVYDPYLYPLDPHQENGKAKPFKPFKHPPKKPSSPLSSFFLSSSSTSQNRKKENDFCFEDSLSTTSSQKTSSKTKNGSKKITNASYFLSFDDFINFKNFKKPLLSQFDYLYLSQPKTSLVSSTKRTTNKVRYMVEGGEREERRERREGEDDEEESDDDSSEGVGIELGLGEEREKGDEGIGRDNNLDNPHAPIPFFLNTQGEEGGKTNEEREVGQYADIEKAFNTQEEGGVDSYEKMCREHIEKYISSASSYIQESELSKRVTNWRNKLEPLIQRQKERPIFVIKDYSSQILSRLKVNQKKKSFFSKLGQRDGNI